jgi:two-component system chemotaxis response regulator CheB
VSITVLLADDAACMRNAIRRLLERDPEIQIVAETSTLDQVIEVAASVRPDVIILDVDLSAIEDLALLRLKSGVCGSRLIGISVWNDDGAKALADFLGAETLLDKLDIVPDLIPAIKRHANVRELSPSPQMAQP